MCGFQHGPKFTHENPRVFSIDESGQVDLHLTRIRIFGVELVKNEFDQDVVFHAEILSDAIRKPWPEDV